MRTLPDIPGRSPRGTTRTRSAEAEATTTVDAQLVESPATEPAGRLVAGRYRLGSLLGRGGMGRVWLAEDELLHRPVALKQISMSDPVSEVARKAALVRALGEARAAARVDHSGAVTIHDVVKEDGRPWIVMENLSGKTLTETLDAEGPLPIDQVTSIGLCLLDVLQATHEAGIVHRDVKPANVHLCDGGRVVLTDFGIAWFMDDSSCLTGPLAGSPAYIAPERLDGERGPASDLFSLGATLFAAVEGRPAFDTGDRFAALAAVVEDAPAPFLRAGPLRPVIEGLLTKEPERRLSAEAARAALRAIAASRYLKTPGGRERDRALAVTTPHRSVAMLSGEGRESR